ncbi:hypothetical protein Bbelb_269840 [Branchiostoma belcheri]|nr:hypothetical protein Bbelb_269840 [Branchiostoma belcheri]
MLFKQLISYPSKTLQALRSYSKITQEVKRSLIDCGIKKPFHARGCRGGRNLARQIPTRVTDKRNIPTFHNNNGTWQRTFHRVIYEVKPPKETRQATQATTPSICLCNPRSLVNKLEEYESFLSDHSVDIGVVAESWFSPNIPEPCLFIEGYTLFSKCRTSRRGGGVAVYVKSSIPSGLLPDITVPSELECVWVTARPKRLPRGVSEVVVGAVYNPPSSPHQDLLLDHLVSVTDDIRTRNPEAGIILLGDFNHLDISQLCNGNNLSQVIKEPTRGQAMLDLIITNLDKHYKTPQILGPLGLSDHNTVLWEPQTTRKENFTKRKTLRPIRDSDRRAFGQWICTQTWDDVYASQTCASKAATFYTTMEDAINKFFPNKQIAMHNKDKPWLKPDIKDMIRRRQKAFSEKKTALWRYLRNKVNREVKKARRSFYRDRVQNLKVENPADWYKEIKTMLNIQQSELSLNIPGHDEADNVFISNHINKKFAEVAQGRPPLDPEQLPAYRPVQSGPPEVSVWDTYNRLRRLKAGKASGPDQLSARILKEFACEISYPVTDIMNASFKEGFVPQAWKDATVVPLPKSHPPSVDKLRPVSLTSQLAKVAESFVSTWILQDVRTSLDTQQFGCLKGRSTTMYLVSLLDFLCRESEKAKNICTMVMTDFSKAYDRIDHTLAIQKLLRLGVRGSLIQWVSDFLTQRRQRVRYGGQLSDWEVLTCSVPQGTLLGPLIFLVVFDDAMRDALLHHWKYVDDLSMTESRHHLEPPLMQDELDNFTRWCRNNHMVLNPDKCKVITFCFMKCPPPPPTLTINGSPLEVVPLTCLLGVWLQRDLKWETQVNKMIGKANGRLFFLRKLKHFNLPTGDLVTIYTSFVRPVLEYCAPVWHPGLTCAQSDKLEAVQRRAVRTILGRRFTSYEQGRTDLNLPLLSDRRQKLCLKFGTHLESHTPSMLPPKGSDYHDRTTRNRDKLLTDPSWRNVTTSTRTMNITIGPGSQPRSSPSDTAQERFPIK